MLFEITQLSEFYQNKLTLNYKLKRKIQIAFTISFSPHIIYCIYLLLDIYIFNKSNIIGEK